MATQPKSKKKLTSSVVFFILVNAILGSSLFYLPSQGVIPSGAASLIAWILLFIIATIIMLYMSELITLFPTSEGTYAYAKHAYGRFVSFFTGWSIWIAGNFGMALAIVAAAEYFIPAATYANYFLLRIIFSLIWILLLNYMAFRGIDAGITMLVTFGIIATLTIIGMTLPSFIDIPQLFQGYLTSPFNLELFSPFFKHEGFAIITYLGLSLLLISEAFLGFETISYMADEVRRPKKIPKILMGAVITCGIIMTLYVFSSLGTVPYGEYVQNPRPWAAQAASVLGPLGETILTFGMYLTIIGSAAGWPIVGSRLIQALSKDKLFLRHFEKKHPKHKSPYLAILFQTIMVILFSWFIFRGYLVQWGDPYRTVYLIYVVLSVIIISLLLLTVPILRKKYKQKRIFKAPLPTVGPVLLVSFFALLIINWIFLEAGLALAIISIALSFLLLGLPIYFFVSMLYDEKAILKVNEWLSYGVLLFEKISFPVSIRALMLKDLGNIKNKTVLEYGCSFGSLTRRIAPLVTKRGRIFATDLALHKVNIADKRTFHFPHVSVHHHPHLKDFTFKPAKKIDTVISVGMLSYMQRPQKILSSLAKHVKKNGEVVFLDYDKFFWLLPNVDWIESNKKLVALFKRSGFEVTVQRKNGLLWQYIIIRGRKL